MSRVTHKNSSNADKLHKYTSEECNDLKEKGDNYMSQGKYAEAAINYTFAMENFPQAEIHFLYNIRSMALLKADQYYFALQDAEKTIELVPTLSKGYIRKGEVQFQAGFYSDAIKSYNQARVRDASDKTIADCVRRANRQLIKTNKETARRPWVFTGSSLLLGLVLIGGDHFTSRILLLQYLILKVLVLAVFGCIGYMAARVYQYTLDKQANILLEEPLDLIGDFKPKLETPPSAEEIAATAGSQKSHKSQSSRHRHRRGRS